MTADDKAAYLPGAHRTNQGVWVATVTHPDGWFECGHSHTCREAAEQCAQTWADDLNDLNEEAPDA